MDRNKKERGIKGYREREPRARAVSALNMFEMLRFCILHQAPIANISRHFARIPATSLS